VTDEASQDELLAQALDELWAAIQSGEAKQIVPAIEALVDVKVALAVEMLADRVQDASGIRP
jgi:uncharacterized membrane protein